MGFNWQMATAGLLGGVSNEADAIEKRRQELENKRLEQEAQDRRDNALLARQEALQKYGYELDKQKNADEEKTTNVAYNPATKEMFTREEVDAMPADQQTGLRDLAGMDVESKLKAQDLNEQKATAEIALHNAEAAKAARPEKPGEFEQKLNSINKLVNEGKVSPEEATAMTKAIYGLKGKGEMTEAQALSFEMRKAAGETQRADRINKYEVKLGEVLDLSGGKITEENLNKVNALQDAMGRPKAEKVQVGEKKDHIWSDKKPVYEYQLPVVDEMPQGKGILGDAASQNATGRSGGGQGQGDQVVIPGKAPKGKAAASDVVEPAPIVDASRTSSGPNPFADSPVNNGTTDNKQQDNNGSSDSFKSQAEWLAQTKKNIAANNQNDEKRMNDSTYNNQTQDIIKGAGGAAQMAGKGIIGAASLAKEGVEKGTAAMADGMTSAIEGLTNIMTTDTNVSDAKRKSDIDEYMLRITSDKSFTEKQKRTIFERSGISADRINQFLGNQ